MFDTRSGFWLIASIAITSILAAGGVILWAPGGELTYSTFATAIRFPVVIILPLIAILAVTSEWSQRTGLTTFTLVPHRGRGHHCQGDLRGRHRHRRDGARLRGRRCRQPAGCGRHRHQRSSGT